MKNKKKLLSSEMTKEVKNEQNKANISRRSFLKRSAYSAPVLMAMGQLMKPENVHAYDPDPHPPWPI